ncbi:MAG: serine/threonine protein kinase, partial [Deltaproteobacteria bacterium]|nr:serine/threonine protein kinase [Deltaproteobacteria bacterium]
MTSFQKKQFGKYLLIDKIGVGGMAEVYIGKITGDEGFEKLLVIKKILPHLTTEDELVKYFIDEAKIAALLQHENIIHVYDFGNIEDSYFIAMEFLFGKDLQLVIKKSSEIELQIGLENILYIASKICDGLDYAHKLKNLQGEALNVIHRDISPQNIFVTYDGHVKIIDFGIAKTAVQSTKTQVGLVKGKLAYMSPEQAGSQVIDHRSDIFAVGIILYELVTARRMFEGETLEIFSRVIEADFEAPENIVADLPPKLIEILNKSLAKDPDHRYKSCSEMLADIEDCLYYLSLRPNARKMSQFMTSLFEREFHDEKTNIIEAMKYTEPEKKETDEFFPVKNVKFEKTIVLGTNYDDSAFLTEGDSKQEKEQTTEILPEEKLSQNKIETRIGKKIWAVIIVLFIISILGAVGYLGKDKGKLTKTIKPGNHIKS